VLLANARLSEEQDGGGGRSDLADPGEHLLHPFTAMRKVRAGRVDDMPARDHASGVGDVRVVMVCVAATGPARGRPVPRVLSSIGDG
jgi:hypothetical protein